MTTSSTSSRTLTALLVAGSALATGVLAVFHPLLALAVAGVILLGLVVVRSPDLAVFAVIFILFSNIAVVATRFHGVPRVIASAFPLLLLVPLMRDIVLRRQGLIVTPALPFLLLLLVVQVIGMMFSTDLGVTSTAVFELITEGILIYILITNVVRTPRTLRLAVWALLAAGALCAVVPLWQQVTGSSHDVYGGLGQTSETAFRTGESTSDGGESRQFRFAGPIGEQNRFAQNMLMLLPLGFLYFLCERSRRKRFLALFLTGLAGAGFLLAFSRGAAVAFVIVFGIMVAMRLVTARYVFLLGLAVLFGLVTVPQYWARLTTIRDIPGVFSDSGTGGRKPDSAITGRVTEMAAAALVFADNPVVGVGPGMFKYHSQEYGNRLGIRKLTRTRKAHSLYLEVAAESGIFGLLSFLGMIVVTVYGLVSVRRRLLDDPGGPGGPGGLSSVAPDSRELACIATGFLLATLAYLASALFLHLSYIRFFYLMLALAGAAARVARVHLRSRV